MRKQIARLESVGADDASQRLTKRAFADLNRPQFFELQVEIVWRQFSGIASATLSPPRVYAAAMFASPPHQAKLHWQPLELRVGRKIENGKLREQRNVGRKRSERVVIRVEVCQLRKAKMIAPLAAAAAAAAACRKADRRAASARLERDEELENRQLVVREIQRSQVLKAAMAFVRAELGVLILLGSANLRQRATCNRLGSTAYNAKTTRQSCRAARLATYETAERPRCSP